MTGSIWWDLAFGVGAALVLAWIALVIALAVLRPRGGPLREALRILPDTLRLIRRLAADKTLPRGVRVGLVLLLIYLAIPFDPIPDFIPVLGYADDAIIITAVLRSVVRRAGPNAVRTHWPGHAWHYNSPRSCRSVMYLTMSSAVMCGMSLSGPTFASCTAARNRSVDASAPHSGFWGSCQ